MNRERSRYYSLLSLILFNLIKLFLEPLEQNSRNFNHRDTLIELAALLELPHIALRFRCALSGSL